MAIDPFGNLFVSHFTGNEVLGITPAGVVFTLATGISQPLGITTDSAGNVYVSSFDTGKIYQIPVSGNIGPSGSSQVIEFATGLLQPDALTFNANGQLFVADRADNSIAKVPLGGGVATPFVRLSQTPAALASGGEQLIVSTAGAGQSALLLVTPAGSVIPAGAGFSSATAVGVAPNGSLFIADAGTRLLHKATARIALDISTPRTASSASISWPISFVTLDVEVSDGLSGSTNWTPPGNKPVVVGNHYRFEFSPSGKAKFYRLKKR